MSEIWISMREKKLSDTLTLMTDTLARVTAERDRLREALKNLLQDTQHAEHEDCEDGPCPVREARAALKGKA